MGKDQQDKFKVLKIPIIHILENDQAFEILSNASNRLNKLIIHVYQFLELWALNKYHKKKNIPKITIDIIQMMFKSLTTESRGPKPKGENGKYYTEFLKFYNNNYKKLNYKNKINGNNLSQMILYTAKSMVTGIENNVKNNFIKYIRRFVQNSFKEENEKLLDTLKGDEKKLTRKQLKKDLDIVKNDIINNTLKSNSKYHKWINLHRPKIVPSHPKKLSYFDIYGTPQTFIPCMIYINLELEKLDTRLYQVFPLRKSIIPHYIPIDTKSLVELFIKKNKQKYLSNLTANENKLWKQIFRMNHNIFKMKNYTFYHYITTDCYSVSIHFINNKYVGNEKKNKANKINGLKAYKKKLKQ